MMHEEARRFIEGALNATAKGLEPVVSARLLELMPGVPDWTTALAYKDQQAGRRMERYNPRDLALMLRALTEHLGTLGYPFSDILDRQAVNCARELRDCRNRWAHMDEFTIAEAYRVLDSAETLLRAVGVEEEAAEVEERKREALSVMISEQVGQPAEEGAVAEFSATTSNGPRRAQPTVDSIPVVANCTARIHVVAKGDLSYAHAHNAIPAISEAVVEYKGDELRAATLTIDIECALGSLAYPRVIVLDLDGKSPATIRDVNLLLDPVRMLAVDTTMKARIVSTLCTAAGDLIARDLTDVDLLSANQWKRTSLHLSIELLAAYIQPNSAAIPPLLKAASEILGERTASSSLDGYQAQSRERVDEIVAAIYDAIRHRDITYAEPPASWGLRGQKVRTPEEVLEGRLGTCLDTTLTMAAVLEEAGINSTLWLVEGHIFLGYWRDEASLGVAADLDASEAINYVGLGQIGLVETTVLTGGTSSMNFADSRRLPEARGLLRGGQVIGVVDVLQARKAAIFPLPSRTVATDGSVVVNEYKVAHAREAQAYVSTPGELAGRTGTPIPRRVALWKNALLDLSLRNRLINFTASAGLGLAVPESNLAEFEDLLNKGTAISLLPSDRISQVESERGIRYGRDLPGPVRTELLRDRKSVFVDVTEGAYTSRLRNTAYKARTIVEETGANNLYVALGLLKWDLDGRKLSSPLILVPVALQEIGRGKSFKIRLDEAEESTPNYCLLEKLRSTFGVEIPGLAEPMRDEFGVHLDATLSATRQTILDAKLPFTVEDSASLAILQFGKFRLWKDLDEHWGEFTSNPLVRHLVHTPKEAFADPIPPVEHDDLDELGSVLPVPADSSQREAVAEAVAGRSFVLEGPPGTGKSQTITNLLARSLSVGRRVLFVAEKRAALDVVKKRLDEVGLGQFYLDLHDKGARPNAVRDQIRAAMDATASPDHTALAVIGEQVRADRAKLRRYAERLYEPNAAGESLYAARDTFLAIPGDIPPLDIPRSFVRDNAPEVVDEIRAVLRRLSETADLVRPCPLNPWGFVAPHEWRLLDTPMLHRAAQVFDAALKEVMESVGSTALLDAVRSAEDLSTWSAIAEANRIPLADIDRVGLVAATMDSANLRTRLREFAGVQPKWTEIVSPDIVNLDVEAIHRAAMEADSSGFFGRKKRQRSALMRFGTSLRVDPKSVPPKEVSRLAGEIAEAVREIRNLHNLLVQFPIPVLQEGWNPLLPGHARDVQSRVDWLTWMHSTLSENADTPFVLSLRDFCSSTHTNVGVATALRSLASAWAGIERLVAVDQSEGQGNDARGSALGSWAREAGIWEAWQSTRAGRLLDSSAPVALDRWVDFASRLEPLRTHGLDEARDALLDGRVDADHAVLSFDRGVAATSIEERTITQSFEGFDASAHNRTISRFSANADEIRKSLPTWLASEIVAARRVNANYEGGRLGELKRQINRQRGGMSVRSLFENYGDLITEIAPCVLMSPESVARFFPASADLFDVVVFDEASQIRVADAVGAMGRARSVVIVGDSKQMPPSAFAEVLTDSGEESNAAPDAVQDEESILSECVQSRVPRKWLTWHYRSQDETLIAFSNLKYYDGKLASFPAPWGPASESEGSSHGISMIRVDGHFERSGKGKLLRTNMVEAKAIVSEVERRFITEMPGIPSLGIITFNAQQRTLIENLLRESQVDAITAALDLSDGLFVKNLENVQGDERDVIMFSVAFSKNDSGVLPLNFGPLTRAGGERRLNVAVTRARRQVILFASFSPSDLRADETTSLGVKHLHAYLEVAAKEGPSQVSAARRALIDRHRDEIAEALKARGYAVHTDVGLSDFRVDIAVEQEGAHGQRVLAILLDGEKWRARRTVADRDGLPESVLGKMLKWPGVERVWLPEWLQDPDATLRRLEDAIQSAEELLSRRLNVDRELAGGVTEVAVKSEQLTDGVRASQADSFPDEMTSDEARWVQDHDAFPGSEPIAVRSASLIPSHDVSELRHPRLYQYQEWSPQLAGTIDVLDGLPSPRARHRVGLVIGAIVEIEGPVDKRRAIKLAAGAFGLSKVHKTRAEAIERCIPRELMRDSDTDCLWPTRLSPETWTDVRQSNSGDGREFMYVPLVEVVNAMTLVVELSGGMSGQEIRREALSLYGGKRVTDGIRKRLDEALALAIYTNRLVSDGKDGYRLPR